MEVKVNISKYNGLAKTCRSNNVEVEVKVIYEQELASYQTQTSWLLSFSSKTESTCRPLKCYIVGFWSIVCHTLCFFIQKQSSVTSMCTLTSYAVQMNIK